MIYTTRNPRRHQAMAFPHVGNIINEIMNAPVKEINKRDAIKYSYPAANVIKHANRYEICLAIPGLSKKDLTIEVDNGQLIISKQSEDQDRNYHLREFNYGKFNRKFQLTEDVDIENIEAKAEDGILYLTLPLIPEPKPIKIKIK